MFIHIFFRKSSQFVLVLVFPPHCINCKKIEGWLCQACLESIALITGLVCERCGTPTSTNGLTFCQQCKNHPLQFINSIRAASYFEDNPIRPAIHFLKYRNHQVAASTLAKILIDAFERYNLGADVIVPVPLHPSRLKERGYNQSELLAREVGKFFDLAVDSNTLQRIRSTKPQMELEANERHKNVAAAFSCSGQKLRGQNILLIDDVCTTGSTLDACAAALKENGATAVSGLTLAKASVHAHSSTLSRTTA